MDSSTLPGRGMHLTQVVFRPDGRRLAALGYPGGKPPARVLVWDTAGGGPVTTYALGEEGGGRPTTYALGEEAGGRPTTYALGEAGSGPGPRPGGSVDPGDGHVWH